jgi:hypothetical protein
MAISVPEVAAHIASSLLIGAAAVVVFGIVASFAARKYGGRSRRRREMIFLLSVTLGRWELEDDFPLMFVVGAFGLMVAGGLMFLRLHEPHG